MPHPFLILFDVDGTILRTNRAGVEAMHKVGRRMFGDGFQWDIETAGGLDPAIFAELAARNGIEDHHLHHDSFHDQYIDMLERELRSNPHKVVVMPGIHELLAALKQRARQRGDVVLGLLTGNYTRAVPIKLRAAGIDPDDFSITAFGDEGRVRPDLTALAMSRLEQQLGHPCDPQRIVIIGDTPRDIDCAHAHGCLAVAVATGSYRLEQLQAAGADVAVADLSDPAPLYRLLVGVEAQA